MFSPFIARHLAILALVVGNFILGVWLLIWTGRHFNNASLLRSVAQRTLAVSYAGAALIALLIAANLFIDVELTPKARQCWLVNRNWPSVRVGMTKVELVRLIGEPAEIHFVDQYLYAIHPLTYSQAGIGFKNPKPTADPALDLDDSAQVQDKNPDDTGAQWIPGDFGSYFRDQYYPLVAGLSSTGLILLAIASLIPRNLRAGWGSLALYYPAVTLVFGLLYEAVQRGGWRFDLLFILPAYAVIAVTWAVRLIVLWRR
jgi:hypothetical protein